MKTIDIRSIESIQIGNAQDVQNATGCTVILCEQGMAAGLDVRGGGPASRESELLKPVAAAEVIHAVLLSGGSAFGLDAAGGVMQYLEERNIGFDVGVTKVPLVCQSCLFDLIVGSKDVRPDKAMGYEACVQAVKGQFQTGNFGAGTGASVGKLHGMPGAMKSGLGTYAVQLGDLQVGAVVAVNALGDVYDTDTGKKLAGLCTPDHTAFLDSAEELYKTCDRQHDLFTGNTTIGAIVTNGAFTKTQLCKIASMAQNGYARAIRPVHTTADGDSIYALSAGRVPADLNVGGTLAADVMAKAIADAARKAQAAYGLPCAADFAEK